MPPLPELSIVIVGWNSAGEIDGCLESLYQHPPSGTFEVFYVDNASTDGSANVVRRRFPGVRVLANARNVGFQRANNQALALAGGEYLLLLNPDTRVLPGSLDALVGFLRRHPEAGAASPCCVFPDGRLQWSVAPFPSLPVIRAWFWTAHPCVARLFGRAAASAPPGVPDQACEQDYAYGACFAVKREVVQRVGPMDEGFFLAGGEVAWSREIRRRGWKIFYVPDATIVHRESVSRGRRSWVSEMDWILAHRRLLYLYDGLRSGFLGDLVFSAHLALLAGQAVARPLSRRLAAPRAAKGPAS